MEGRIPRKKIPVQRKELMTAEPDAAAWVKNMSSDKVRIAANFQNCAEVTLCFDKHYLDRVQHGDDWGEREGIDTHLVEELVRGCFGHLLCYCGIVEGFRFLNRRHVNEPRPLRPLRIVCRRSTEKGLLHVIIEAYFLELNNFEITVMTAMCKDDFEVSDSQYLIELDVDNSTLFRMKQRKLNEISSI